ncbi:hypothetical protein [Streptomyces hirsutus]|uniref:hypothetical protein n=1 Tax=Streptomyces hirsutus TaxID=35620 RepID=UPI000B16D55C|nr:hypothetical protein [Streptomyces hirsutus]
MTNNLDALATAIYVKTDDLLKEFRVKAPSGVAVAEAGPSSCRRRGGHVVTGVATDAL